MAVNCQIKGKLSKVKGNKEDALFMHKTVVILT